MADDDSDSPSVPLPTLQLCFCVLGVSILVVAGISGPIYAFTAVTCISTRPCEITQALSKSGARCTEYPGEVTLSLLHGEICNLECIVPDFVPSSPALTCVDGYADGSENLECVLPPEPPSLPSFEAALADYAITSGEARLACPAAKYFQCKTDPGTSLILIQLEGLSRIQCDALFEECRDTNPIFMFQMFSSSEEAAAYAEDPENKTKYDAFVANPGSCTLGCTVSKYTEEQLTEFREEMAAAEAQAEAAQAFPVDASSLVPTRTCSDEPGPTCLKMVGSCNAEMDGDFYKHPVCVSGQAQWAKTTAMHRIRYDGDENNGQAGKWILEQSLDASGIDLTRSGYGAEVARQPTFNPSPIFDEAIWNFKCRFKTGVFSEYIEYSTRVIALTECSCTSEIDCNGQGTAIGSKEFGPNCRCMCEKNRAGDQCEIPLCQAPGVIGAHQPSCKEGNFIHPDQKCTPDCMDGFAAPEPFYTCYQGMFLLPSGFVCDKVFQEEEVPDEFGLTADAYLPPETTPIPDCASIDCTYRGTPTGFRRADGSCECICDKRYDGPQCRTILGNCTAPLQRDIPFSSPSPCAEGGRVSVTCTGICKEGYTAIPPVLACNGDTLEPRLFRCIGGESLEFRWCEMMQYFSLIFSALSFVGVVVLCYCFQSYPERHLENIFMSEQRIEVLKDENGEFNVIKMEGKEDFQSKLPSRICALGNPDNMWADAIQDVSPMQSPDQMSRSRRGLPLEASPAPISPLKLREMASSDGFERTGSDVFTSTASDFLKLRDDAGLPGQASFGRALALTAEPPLRKGREVILRNVIGRLELDGARGWLIDYDHETGLCEIDLEGTEIIRRVPENCVEEVVATPEETLVTQSDQVDVKWLVQVRDIEGKVEARRRERVKKFASEEKKAEMEKGARISAALQATAEKRYDLEDGMAEALRSGDSEKLRTLIAETDELLQDHWISQASAVHLTSLRRVVDTAKSRLEQFDQLQESRQRVDAYQERIRTGQAADWKMTSDELWQYVKDCNTERVRAGLKAKLPVFLRSTDGQRFTIVHEACREACLDEPGSEKAQNRLEVVKLLIDARANVNAIDKKERTSVDLAIETGGEDAARHPVVKELKKLGLLSARQAARAALGDLIEDDEEDAPKSSPPAAETPVPEPEAIAEKADADAEALDPTST